MTHHVPFQVSIRTIAPAIISSGRLTLDGLLSAAVYAETGLQGAQTYDRIPLARTGELFHGSSIFVKGVYKETSVSRVGSVTKYCDFRKEEAFPQQGKKVTNEKMGLFLSPVMSYYQGCQADEFLFFGLGNPDEVQRLFDLYIPHIGRGHNRGFGAIDTVDVSQIDEDRSIMLEDGSPARPIPLQVWTEVFDGCVETAMIMPHSWRAPYWETSEVLCVVPETLSLQTQQVLAELTV